MGDATTSATAAACGADPCGWFDYVWVSDECQTYLACSGQPAMTISAQLGAGLKDIVQGTGSAVGTGLTGLATPSWLIVGLVVAAGIAVYAAASR